MPMIPRVTRKGLSPEAAKKFKSCFDFTMQVLVAEGDLGKPFFLLNIMSAGEFFDRLAAVDKHNDEVDYRFNNALMRVPDARRSIDAEPIVTRWQDCKDLLSKIEPEVLTRFIAGRMGL